LEKNEKLKQAIRKTTIESIRSPLRYMGGKFYQAKWIIENFPEHDIYVEPFGGAAHVLMQKPFSKIEVYNDLNESMVNLFKVLQDEELSQQLIKFLYLTPHSRGFFYDVRDMKYTIPTKNEMLQKAYRTCVMMKQSFPANVMSRTPSWSFVRGRTPGSLRAKTTASFNNFPKRLLEVIDRIKQVQIESLDFVECIKKYDTKNTFFYCDPPYLGVADAEKYYGRKFTMRDHYDLANILKNIKGKACVSYYQRSILDRFYSGWHKVVKGYYKYSGKSQGSKTPSKEILYMNCGDDSK